MAEHPKIFCGPMVLALLDDRKTQTREVMKPQPPARVKRLIRQNDGLFWEASLGDMPLTGDWRVFTPYQPGDYLWARETFASPSRGLVAFRADAECGAWMGDGGGGRIWNHHGYVLDESTRDQYAKATEPFWTFGLGKYGGKWKSPIHMPRWASRILREVTAARPERLQDISEEDAKAEGVEKMHLDDLGQTWKTYRRGFRSLWDSLYASPKRVKTNPYTGAKEDCYVSYPWEDVQRIEKRRGLTHYIIGNPHVWVYDIRRIKQGSIREALDAVWEAGGKVWDDIDDPESVIREMRGY